MLDPTANGGSKLAAALTAAGVFLDQLHLAADGDQAAIVTFDHGARGWRVAVVQFLKSDTWQLRGESGDLPGGPYRRAAVATGSPLGTVEKASCCRDHACSQRHMSAAKGAWIDDYAFLKAHQIPESVPFIIARG